MIRSAQKGDIPHIARLMAAAFWDDDAFRRYFKGMRPLATATSREERTAALAPIFERQLEHDYFPDGVVDVWEDPELGIIGAANWSIPNSPVGFSIGTYRAMYGWNALTIMLRDAYSLKFHPGQEHWYLYTLTVAPEAQGKGVGSALLRHGLQRADRSGYGTYLEATTPDSQRLYERLGFAVTGEIPTKDEWPNEVGMFREPN